MKYAVLVGIAPIVLVFLLALIGVPVPALGWSVYIAWFVLSIAIGAAVVAIKSRT